MNSLPSDYRKLSKLRGERSINFIQAAVVGIAAGIVAVLFRYTLIKAEHVRDIVFTYAKSLPESGFIGSGLLLFVFYVAGLASLAAWITVKYAPEATGSGIPHTKAVLLHLRQLSWQRLIPVKFFAGVLALGSGFSLGREGPTVQLGAAVGAATAKILKAPRRSRTHLISCGAGAGLAAAFNAPLAGFIFVIEELRRELSPLTYGTAIIAAVFADVVTRASFGNLPAFSLKNFPSLPLTSLPIVVIIGIVTGLVGVSFNAVLIRTLEEVPKLRNYIPRWLRAALIAVIVASIGWFLPHTLGSGNEITQEFLTATSLDEMGGLKLVFLLFVLKYILTILCYSAGVPGGIFAPLLAHGALLGILISQLIALAFPSLSLNLSTLGIVGMASYFAAVVRAPLTGVILILEMTANYDLLFLLLTGSMISYLISEAVHVKPIYESLLQLNLSLRGHRETEDKEPVLVEMVVEPQSIMDNRKVKELELPDGCLLVTVKKAGEEHIPKGETRLEAGDEVTVVISGPRGTNTSILRSLALSP